MRTSTQDHTLKELRRRRAMLCRIQGWVPPAPLRPLAVVETDGGEF